MQLLLLSALLLHSSILTAQSVIFNQSGTQGRDVTLVCNKEGKVIWEKGTDRGRSAILSAEKGEIITKYKPDPENRYSVKTDSSLLIKNLSLSDSGIYYCNAVPVVNLTVYPPPPPADSRPTTTSTKTTTGRKHIRTPPSTTGRRSTTTSTKTTTGRKHIRTPPSTTDSRPTTTSTKTTTGRKHIRTPPSTTDSRPTITSTKTTTGRKHIRTPPSTTDSRPTITSTKTTTGRKHIRTPPSTTDSRPTITSTKTTTGNIIAAALAGVGLILLAVGLLRCYFKKKATTASKTDHVYETVNDTSVPAPQPGAAPQKVYEAIYILAGDPDVIKLGLKNQTDDSPLIPKPQSTEKPNELVYSTVQAVNTTNELVYSTVQAVDTVRNEDIPALQPTE
ncbi:uncharacterized protein [Salminus brasiliensis]|uniref:uncharacterized protein isoform X1 n=1 Tax=Salminus brasiliensis TaxID=930266 RepID=UPI003B82F896